MKKILATLLALITVCYFAACGSQPANQNNDKSAGQGISSEADDEKNGEIDLSMIKEKSSDYLVIDEKILLKNLETVTLTKDNWNQYFDDFDYVEHIEEKNAFGETKTEYDKYHYGFGLKNEYIGALNGVAFKFDGKKEKILSHVSNLEDADETLYDDLLNETIGYTKQYNEYKINTPVVKVLDKDGNLIEEKEGENTESFLLELEYRTVDRFHYAEYECLDIVGEIKVVKISDELKEELKNFRNGIWVDHGGFAEPLTQWLEKSFE